MTDQLEALKKLREEFPPNLISKLPKPFKRDAPKGQCRECGGYHGLPAMHLDYVGHAALTSRLLDVDPLWTWEPVAFDEQGLPALDRSGGLWIRLTVCGVTRLGYGIADRQEGGNAMKERIGDALRNAAMRFGAALDLWHKGGDFFGKEQDDDPKHDQTTTPQARAERIVSDFRKGGDAQDLANLMAGWEQSVNDEVWPFLPADVQEALNKAWPA